MECVEPAFTTLILKLSSNFLLPWDQSLPPVLNIFIVKSLSFIYPQPACMTIFL